jgi:hypothetical protein
VVGVFTLPRQARVRWIADAASEGSTTTGAAVSSVRFTSREQPARGPDR